MAVRATTQIKRRLAARNPVLLVVTHEEHRAIDALVTTVETYLESYTSVWVWTCGKGVEQVWSRTISDPKQLGSKKMEQPNPVEPLEWLKEDKNKNVLLVVKDYMYFLNGGSGYMIGRALKDTAYHLQHGLKDDKDHRSIVIVDSDSTIPDRLEKLVCVVDFDLPTQKEIYEKYLPELAGYMEGKEQPLVEEATRTFAKATVGLTMPEVDNALAISIAVRGGVDTQTLLNEKKAIIRKSNVLEYFEGTGDLSTVGGLSNLKSWLKVRKQAFSEEAATFGLPTPRAMLMAGVPGCGKSMVAKSIGAEWDIPVIRLDVGALLNSFVGASESNMRKALKTAETIAPCVLFIDEIEKALGRSGENDGGTTTRLFGTFLTWMADKTAPVFVVATANDISRLPPEMLRAGRFDALFFVDLPNQEERQEIIKLMQKKFARTHITLDTKMLAEATAGFSGAELESLFTGALYEAFYAKTDLNTTLLVDQASRLVPLSSTMSAEIDALRGWSSGRTIPATPRVSEHVSEAAGTGAQLRRVKKVTTLEN